MCAECVKAVSDTFPEVPDNEIGDFLMNCTAFPLYSPTLIKEQSAKC